MGEAYVGGQKMDKGKLKAGDLIAFRIGTQEGFSAPNKDRWGCMKVLHAGNPKQPSISVSVKDGLWKDKPSFWQALRAPILIEKRFGAGSLVSGPLIFTTSVDWELDLLDVEVLGRAFWFNSIERKARKNIRQDGYYHSIAPIDHAPHSIDHEYRAEFDAELWSAELDAYRERQQRERQVREQWEKTRLKSITLGALRDETQFADWEERVRIVPREFTQAVRDKSNEVIAQLVNLGPKPRRKDVRSVLKDYYSWLNAFDGSFGYLIETEEREDLVQFAEELCWATKQKPLIQEMDNWRDW